MLIIRDFLQTVILLIIFEEERFFRYKIRAKPHIFVRFRTSIRMGKEGVIR